MREVAEPIYASRPYEVNRFLQHPGIRQGLQEEQGSVEFVLGKKLGQLGGGEEPRALGLCIYTSILTTILG